MGTPVWPENWPPPNYVNPPTRGSPALFIIMCAITTAVVILRIYSRCFLTRSFGMDDWLLLAGYILSIGQTFAEYKALTTWGWNKHLYDVPLDRVEFVRLAAWLVEFFFLLGNACTKVSILLVYRKISSGSQNYWFIRLTWAAIAFTIIYTLSLGLELMLVCRPLDSYWKSYSPTYKEEYTCGDEHIPLVFSAAASVSSDIYASVLPMLLTSKLKLTSKQRLSLCVLFSAGLLTAAIGTARMAYLVKITTNYKPGPHTDDVTWYGWPTFALTDIEAHLAIICASAPALRVFFTRQLPGPLARVHASVRSMSFRHGSSRLGSDDHDSSSFGAPGAWKDHRHLDQGMQLGQIYQGQPRNHDPSHSISSDKPLASSRYVHIAELQNQ